MSIATIQAIAAGFVAGALTLGVVIIAVQGNDIPTTYAGLTGVAFGWLFGAGATLSSTPKP